MCKFENSKDDVPPRQEKSIKQSQQTETSQRRGKKEKQTDFEKRKSIAEKNAEKECFQTTRTITKKRMKSTLLKKHEHDAKVRA